MSRTAMEHSYDTTFMDYTDRSSRHSARTIARLLREVLPIDSVLDIGCAKGTWLAAWREAGVEDVFGVDGDYVDTNALHIPREKFTAADLAKSIDLGRRFALVQSLEVAEHVRADAADQFVANLVRHADGVILFSAAPPGQGGEFHVNEQPYDYWRTKFRTAGYEAYDYVRPLIAGEADISFWYRYNTLLYLRADVASAVPESIRRTRIADASPVADVSPTMFRLRKSVIRCLPYPVQHRLARLKARYARASTRR
jgi:SAM-dependent methyltransferase